MEAENRSGDNKLKMEAENVSGDSTTKGLTKVEGSGDSTTKGLTKVEGSGDSWSCQSQQAISSTVLLVFGHHRDGHGAHIWRHDLYSINLDEDDDTDDCYGDYDEPQILDPVLPDFTVNDIMYGSSWGALGSKIFNLGGMVSGGVTSSNVLVFDTEFPEKGWCSSTSMIGGKFLPSVVSISGKLYVFGSWFPCIPWGEVYDPEEDKWTSFGPPPSTNPSLISPLEDPPSIYESGPVVYAYGVVHNKLFLTCSLDEINQIHCLNLDTLKWDGQYDEEMITNPPDIFKEYYLSELYCGNLIVDQTLYFVSGGKFLFALDLSQRSQLYPVVGPNRETYIHDSLEDSSICNFKHLFYLGDQNFCMIWSDPSHFGRAHPLHCLKFHLLPKDTVRQHIRATILSYNCYSVEAADIRGCFKMNELRTCIAETKPASDVMPKSIREQNQEEATMDV